VSNLMDSTSGQENGPVTPTNRSRSNTMSTNSFSNDMTHNRNDPYESYADSGSGSQIKVSYCVVDPRREYRDYLLQ